MSLRLDAVIARELAADAGLSMADYDVLSSLEAADGRRVRLTALADRMLWSKGRLSRQIARMEQRGLVRREPTEDDARGANVTLTAAGLKAIETAAPGHVEAVRAHFIDLLSREQLRALGDVTWTVIDHIAEAGQLPPVPPDS